MRSEAALADRRQSVRDEAKEWLRAGWIDKDAFGRIEKMYPDDRVRTGIAFRILFFILTFAAIAGFLVALYSQSGDDEILAVLALMAGVGCAATAEYLINTANRRQGGIEAAFSIAALVNLMTASAIFLLHGPHEHPGVIAFLFLSAILFGAAAWLWGYWPYMACSAAFCFFGVMNLPYGRLGWFLAVALLCRGLSRVEVSPALPPSLRKSATAFLAIAVLGLYAGSNIYLLDHHALNWFGRPEFFPRWLSMALTTIVPCLVLVLGVYKRRRLLLLLGFSFAILSLITLRMYIHVAPLWLVLTSGGLVLLLGAGWLRRYLDSGSGGERKGFTAAHLRGQPEKHRVAEMLAGITTMTPEASSPDQKGEFHPGGGEFGGGGASDRF